MSLTPIIFILTLILIATLFVMSPSSLAPKQLASESTIRSAVTSTPTLPNVASSSTKPETPCIATGRSDKYPEWKVYKSENKYASSTIDWHRFSLWSGCIPWVFQYPPIWTVRNSIFYDTVGEKVAELLPGAVRLQTDQHCFDSQDDVSGLSQGRMEVISEENINIGGLSGRFRMMKGQMAPGLNLAGTPIPPGDVYHYSYCLEEDDSAFMMAFYSRQRDPKERELFDKILSTFNFN